MALINGAELEVIAPICTLILFANIQQILITCHHARLLYFETHREAYGEW